MQPEDIDDIRIAIREELMALSSKFQPPPCDNEAEREVVGALLSGFIKTDELGPLQSKHFCHPIRRELYLYAKANTPTSEAVENHLRAIGFVGNLGDWITVARDYPWRGKQSCRDAVRRILETYRERQLLDFLESIQAGIRCGSHTTDEAIALLRAKVTASEQTRRAR